jgi:transposase
VRLPDFLIIGAMKSATSTLHDQLARQPGLVMSDPKEPYFFSDDPVYANGIAWYASLFDHARPGDLCGESTTHYAKRPTYPETIARIRQHIPDARFIYVMRHPLDRLVSQYIHQWTEREIDRPIDTAIIHHPELIAYSCYAWQLEPYFEAFGRDRVLPLFLDHLQTHPQAALEQVCRFIGYRGDPVWQHDLEQRNISSERMRANPWRDALVNAPLLATLRKRLIPQAWRDRIKQLWQMRQRPQLGERQSAELCAIFDADLARLGQWLGVSLNCANFREATRHQPLTWQPGKGKR